MPDVPDPVAYRRSLRRPTPGCSEGPTMKKPTDPLHRDLRSLLPGCKGFDVRVQHMIDAAALFSGVEHRTLAKLFSQNESKNREILCRIVLYGQPAFPKNLNNKTLLVAEGLRMGGK